VSTPLVHPMRQVYLKPQRRQASVRCRVRCRIYATVVFRPSRYAKKSAAEQGEVYWGSVATMLAGPHSAGSARGLTPTGDRGGQQHNATQHLPRPK